MCSSSQSFFLSDQEDLYSYTSCSDSGSLCTDERPTNLKQYPLKIKNFSIWDSHAWAIDNKGKLYTWGTGLYGELGHENIDKLDEPTLVNTGESIEIKESKVSKGYTAFKTSGGHLYVIGSLSSHKNPLSSLVVNQNFDQVKGISNYFIRSFWCGLDFIVILTQTGEVIYVNEHFQVIKIYSDKWRASRCRDDRLEHLTVNHSHIIAMSRNKLYIWKPCKVGPSARPSSNRKNSECQNMSMLENSKWNLSSERNNIEKHLYSKLNETIKVILF
jgi:alpha-tubulin suppressor-like RCC1 family protein